MKIRLADILATKNATTLDQYLTHFTSPAWLKDGVAFKIEKPNSERILTIKFPLTYDLGDIEMPNGWPNNKWARNLFGWMIVANKYEKYSGTKCFVRYSRTKTSFVGKNYLYSDMINTCNAIPLVAGKGCVSLLGDNLRGMLSLIRFNTNIPMPKGKPQTQTTQTPINYKGISTHIENSVSTICDGNAIEPEFEGPNRSTDKMENEVDSAHFFAQQIKEIQGRKMTLEEQRKLIITKGPKNKFGEKPELKYDKIKKAQISPAKILRTYNELLALTRIEFIADKDSDAVAVDLAKGAMSCQQPYRTDAGTHYPLNHLCFHRRIFNNGVLTDGGRVYSEIQNIPSKLRRGFKINNCETACLDYSGLHFRMAYHSMGIDYQDDPYAYSQPPWRTDGRYTTPALTQENRKRWKLITNVLMNAESEESANKAIAADQMEYRIESTKPGIYLPFGELINCVKQKHPQLADLFCSGAGVRFQFEDSELALAIIDGFIARRIPLIAIHDGFVCQEQDRESLRSIMAKVYKERFGFDAIIKDEW